MRTVDATLTAALAKGHGRPILTGYIGYSNGTVKHSEQVLSYKLTGQSLEFKMQYVGDFASDQTHMWLERGMSIGGTDYTITTGRFRILEQLYLEDGTQVCRGALFPNQYYSAPGDDTYENVITDLCDAFGKTAVFKDGTQAWLDYQFMADGEQIEVTDANKVLAMLQQKRLITLCDNGDEEVLVYCADVQGTIDATLSPTHDFKLVNTKMRARQYVWVDEDGAYHQSGTSSNPIHNLGYLESTDSAPSRKTWSYELDHVILPDLRYLDGDILKFSLYGGTKFITFFAQIVEEFNPGTHGIPAWRTRIQCNPIFHETAGGDGIPAALRVGNYQPLTTSRFKNVLTSNEVDVQAALDKLDAGSREKLFTDRNYYVRTDGSDSNDGLSNTSAGAFLTIQKAVDVAAALDTSISDVYINLNDGAHAAETVLLKNTVGAGIIYIVGNTGTPSNCTFAGRFTKYDPGTIYHVRGMKFTGSLTSCLTAWDGALIRFDAVDFGGSYSVHLDGDQGGIIEAVGSYTVSATTYAHIWMHSGSLCRIDAPSMTVTLSGTPDFVFGFVYTTRNGVVIINKNEVTFSGSATGPRYAAELNSVIQTNGGGASYLPGDSAGSTATGGQYA